MHDKAESGDRLERGNSLGDHGSARVETADGAIQVKAWDDLAPSCKERGPVLVQCHGSAQLMIIA